METWREVSCRWWIFRLVIEILGTRLCAAISYTIMVQNHNLTRKLCEITICCEILGCYCWTNPYTNELWMSFLPKICPGIGLLKVLPKNDGWFWRECDHLLQLSLSCFRKCCTTFIRDSSMGWDGSNSSDVTTLSNPTTLSKLTTINDQAFPPADTKDRPLWNMCTSALVHVPWWDSIPIISWYPKNMERWWEFNHFCWVFQWRAGVLFETALFKSATQQQSTENQTFFI